MDLDLSALDAQDEGTLAIKHPLTDAVTTWVWTLYGPAHPKTIELANRVSRVALGDFKALKQAMLSGKKVPEGDEDPEKLRGENIASIVARTKSFTPVKIGAETIEFSPEAAQKLLSDRRKGWLLKQLMDYLKAEENFIQPSAVS